MAVHDNIPLLSICIPTYSRKDIFIQCYSEIKKQVAECSDAIEINVSVNPSGDGTEEWLAKENGQNIHININKENIGADKNIRYVANMARGKYIWLLGDDDIILKGTLQKVVNVLKENPDISWLYMNYGYLNSENILLPNHIVPDKTCGLHSSARKAIAEVGKYIDGGILFTSSNIYRTSALKKMNDIHVTDVLYTLYCTFAAALEGQAYVFGEVMINQGQEILWKDIAYTHTVRTYNETILNMTKVGYDKREVLKMVKYRMRHKALSVWFILYKKILTDFKQGISDYAFYLRIMPSEALCITVFSPIIFMYLHVRHYVRNKKREKLYS